MSVHLCEIGAALCCEWESPIQKNTWVTCVTCVTCILRQLQTLIGTTRYYTFNVISTLVYKPLPTVVQGLFAHQGRFCKWAMKKITIFFPPPKKTPFQFIYCTTYVYDHNKQKIETSNASGVLLQQKKK